MPWRLVLAVLVLTVVVLATACAGANPPPGAADRPQNGRAVTVEEALASDANEPLLVRGALIAQGEDVRLCGAILESYPPQCGEPSLIVHGAELGSLPDLQREGTVRWVDQAELVGTVTDHVLHVTTASGY